LQQQEAEEKTRDGTADSDLEDLMADYLNELKGPVNSARLAGNLVRIRTSGHD